MRFDFHSGRFARVLSLPALIAVPFLCHGQDAPQPTGILDIEWGASVADAKNLLNRRTDIAELEETGDGLDFTGRTFADYQVREWELKFAGGKFSEAIITFVYPEGKITGIWASDVMYDKLKTLIAAKYGGEGVFSGGSRAGHNMMVWTFPDSPTSKGVKEIKLYYGWDHKLMTLTYGNRFYEAGGARAAATDF